MIINTKDQFIHELEKRMLEEIDRLKMAALHGQADIGEHRKITGQFIGISNVLAIIEDLKSDNDGRDR